MRTNRRSGSPGPQNIGARAWGFVARATVRKFADDGGGDIAAALTFHAILALVPALLVGVSVISLLGTDSTAVAFALEIVRAVAPEDTAATIGRAVDSLAESALGGPVLVLAAGLTIWAIARYIAVLGRGMNRVYEVEEGRSPWALKSMQIGGRGGTHGVADLPLAHPGGHRDRDRRLPVRPGAEHPSPTIPLVELGCVIGDRRSRPRFAGVRILGVGHRRLRARLRPARRDHRAAPLVVDRDRSRIVRKQARRSTEIAEARRLRDHP